MPYKLKDPVRHKFQKKSYNNRDWKTYETGLKNRGNITIWFSEDAISSWYAPDEAKKKRGRSKKYSDLAIETAHTLRLIYHQALRQTEGFLTSIVKLMGLDLQIPDHTTFSRRGNTVPLSKHSSSPSKDENSVVIVDSTGLKVFGEKEWMNYKHGTRRRKVWRKLHLSVDEQGEILSSTLTHHTTSDPSQVEDLLQDIDTPIDEVIGDGGYDADATYSSLHRHQKRHNQPHPIKAIIPPNIEFKKPRKTDDEQRLHNIGIIADKGKICWQNQVNFGRRARVENTMHRYKSTFGNKLRSRNFQNQIAETKIAVQILNRMAKLGMPTARPSM